MVRSEIMAGHRFHSFANQRGENFVKWCVLITSTRAVRYVNHNHHYGRHIDGHDYMWAVSELLDKAQEAIFILVSTLSPRYSCACLRSGLSPSGGACAIAALFLLFSCTSSVLRLGAGSALAREIARVSSTSRRGSWCSEAITLNALGGRDL